MIPLVLAGLAVVAWQFLRSPPSRNNENRESDRPDQTAARDPSTDLRGRTTESPMRTESAPALAAAPETRPSAVVDRPPPKTLLSAVPPIGPGLPLGQETSPDPEKRRRAEARAAEAQVLDARLEQRIADLKARLRQASPAEQRAISADLELLQRNLVRRRAWEDDGHASAGRPNATGR